MAVAERQHRPVPQSLGATRFRSLALPSSTPQHGTAHYSTTLHAVLRAMRFSTERYLATGRDRQVDESTYRR